MECGRPGGGVPDPSLECRDDALPQRTNAIHYRRVVGFGARDCSATSKGTLDEELDAPVKDVVRRDPSIKNCLLSVRKGDGSLSWIYVYTGTQLAVHEGDIVEVLGTVTS